jgi:hypothetical protein
MRFVHLAGKHAPEFQLRNVGLQFPEVTLDRYQGIGVILFCRYFQQLIRVLQRLAHPVQGQHDFFQPRPLAAQLLGTFRVAPDFGVFQLPNDFGQPFALVIEVKDTP